MRSRLSCTVIGLLIAGCLDDTAALTSGPRPTPIPPAPPAEVEPTAAGQGGDGGSGGEPGSEPTGGDSSAGASTLEVPMEVCQPTDEVCNGKDDDCNGKSDEGCPLALAWKTSFERPALGDSPGGVEFGTSCAKNELLVGLKVAVGAWVDQVSGVCRKFALETDESTSPYRYSFSFLTSRTLEPFPAQTSSELTDLLCDEHQALVGLRISQQNYVVDGQVQFVVIPSLWIVCAEPVLELGGELASVRWQDAVEIGPVAGAFADGTAWFAEDQLTTPALAVSLHGAAGAWVDRLGLAASSIASSFH